MAEGSGKRVTMQDVADRAGVAKITVSRALGGSPLVRPDVRERVNEAARALGYRFNTAARNLRLQRTHSVTAVIETEPGGERSVAEPLVQMAIGGMLGELAQARYQLVLTTRSMIEFSGAADADGIVVLGQGANDEAARTIVEFGQPTVVWGAQTPNSPKAVYVGSDNFDGGRLVGRHFVELGRKSIVFLGDTTHLEVKERERGLRQALGRKAKLQSVSCEFTASAGQTAMAELLKGNPDIDGVAAASDAIAIGAMVAIADSGRRVPADVAVVGYDDTGGDIGLSSVRQEWVLAGKTLASKVLQLINGEDVQSEQLPVQLIVRASSSKG